MKKKKRKKKASGNSLTVAAARVRPYTLKSAYFNAELRAPQELLLFVSSLAHYKDYICTEFCLAGAIYNFCFFETRTLFRHKM